MQSYRAGFDVSTPVFNALTQTTAATVRRDTSIPQRPRLLTVLASGAVPSTVAWQLDSLIHRQSTDDVLVLESCPPGRVSRDQLPWKRCKWNSNEVVDYLEALQVSDCLDNVYIRMLTPSLPPSLPSSLPPSLPPSLLPPAIQVLCPPALCQARWSWTTGRPHDCEQSYPPPPSLPSD